MGQRRSSSEAVAGPKDTLDLGTFQMTSRTAVLCLSTFPFNVRWRGVKKPLPARAKHRQKSEGRR